MHENKQKIFANAGGRAARWEPVTWADCVDNLRRIA